MKSRQRLDLRRRSALQRRTASSKSAPAWSSIRPTALDYLVSGFFAGQHRPGEAKAARSPSGPRCCGRTSRTSLLEPSARLLWTPTAKHTFWAAFTRAIRTPSRAEHDFYLSSYLGRRRAVPFFARFNANPDFAPEQLNGYEVGYRPAARRTSLSTSPASGIITTICSARTWRLRPTLETHLPFPEPVRHRCTRSLRPSSATTCTVSPPDRRSPRSGGLPASGGYEARTLSEYESLEGRREPPWAEHPPMVVGSSPRHEGTAQASFDAKEATRPGLSLCELRTGLGRARILDWRRSPRPQTGRESGAVDRGAKSAPTLSSGVFGQSQRAGRHPAQRLYESGLDEIAHDQAPGTDHGAVIDGGLGVASWLWCAPRSWPMASLPTSRNRR